MFEIDKSYSVQEICEITGDDFRRRNDWECYYRKVEDFYYILCEVESNNPSRSEFLNKFIESNLSWYTNKLPITNEKTVDLLSNSFDVHIFYKFEPKNINYYYYGKCYTQEYKEKQLDGEPIVNIIWTRKTENNKFWC